MIKFYTIFFAIIIIFPSISHAQLTDRKYTEGVTIKLEHYTHSLFSSNPKLKKSWKLENTDLIEDIIKKSKDYILMDEKEAASYEAKRKTADMFVLSYINYTTNSATKIFLNKTYITVIQNVNMNTYYEDKANFERFLKKQSMIRKDILTDTNITAVNGDEIVVKYKKFQTLKQNPSWIVSDKNEIVEYLEYIENLNPPLKKDPSMTSRIRQLYKKTGFFTIYPGTNIFNNVKKIMVGKGFAIKQTYERNKKNYKNTEETYEKIREIVEDKYTYE